MMTNDELYALCDTLRYRVRPAPLKSAPAASLPGGCIILNPERIPDAASEKVILAHELGHLETGSFSTGSPADLDGRHEERADRWAIRKLLPAVELCDVLESGMVELYQLAEYFGVNEEIVVKALEYYRSSSGLSLTPDEQKAVLALRDCHLVTATFRKGGAPARLVLSAAMLNSLVEAAPSPPKKCSPAAPLWGFVRDGNRIVLEEIPR